MSAKCDSERMISESGRQSTILRNKTFTNLAADLHTAFEYELIYARDNYILREKTHAVSRPQIHLRKLRIAICPVTAICIHIYTPTSQ